MKRRIGMGMIGVLGLLLLGACGGSDQLPPGTYEGSGTGYSKDTPIRLSVTIDESGKIFEINLLENAETKEIGGKALDKLLKQAVEEKKADVDTISGATRTSEGFRDAVKQALEKAKEAQSDQ